MIRNKSFRFRLVALIVLISMLRANRSYADDVMPIAQARTAANGTSVIVQGTVTVAPHILDTSGHGIYVQDSTGGISVYLAEASLPDLAEGDTVTVNGKITVFANHPEIKVATTDAVIKIESGQPVKPMLIHSIEAAAHAGQLAQIQGKIVAVVDTYFVVTDSANVNEDDIHVFINPATRIALNILAGDQPMCIAGLIDPYFADLEILPRHIADIQIGACPAP